MKKQISFTQLFDDQGNKIKNPTKDSFKPIAPPVSNNIEKTPKKSINQRKQ